VVGGVDSAIAVVVPAVRADVIQLADLGRTRSVIRFGAGELLEPIRKAVAVSVRLVEVVVEIE
jgi:hypothetical protein